VKLKALCSGNNTEKGVIAASNLAVLIILGIGIASSLRFLAMTAQTSLYDITKLRSA
jgi:hypothetical protein